MALIKTPDGGWLVDDQEFIVDYQENSVKLKNPGGGGTGGDVTAHNNDPNAHEVVQLDCGVLG